MAIADNNSILRNAAIQGLHKQILENAVVLFPEIVREHRQAMLDAYLLPMSQFEHTAAFKIITSKHRLDSAFIDVHKVKAILLKSLREDGDLVAIVESELEEDRGKALEGLLQKLEERVCSEGYLVE